MSKNYDIFDPLAEERKRLPLSERGRTDPVVYWLRQLFHPESRSPIFQGTPLTVLRGEERPPLAVAVRPLEADPGVNRLLVVGGLAVAGDAGLQLAVHYDARHALRPGGCDTSDCVAYTMDADQTQLTQTPLRGEPAAGRRPLDRPIPLRPHDEYGARERADLAGVLRETVVGDQQPFDPVASSPALCTLIEAAEAHAIGLGAVHRVSAAYVRG